MSVASGVVLMTMALLRPLPEGAPDEVIIVEADPETEAQEKADRRRRRLLRELREAESEREEQAAQAQENAAARAAAEARVMQAQAALERERAVRSELEERNAAARSRARREAARLQAEGKTLDAVQTLASFGRAFEEPELLLDAAELRARAEDRRARAEAQTLLREAQALLDRPAVQAALGSEGVSTLRQRHRDLESSLVAAPRRASSAVLPLAVGSGVAAVAVAGFGVLGGGVYLERRRQEQLEALRAAGIDPTTVDLAPLDAQGRRARTMMVVGAVSGPTGLVLGGALIGVGLHRLRTDRKAADERLSSLRLSPMRNGISLRGRF